MPHIIIPPPPKKKNRTFEYTNINQTPVLALNLADVFGPRVRISALGFLRLGRAVSENALIRSTWWHRGMEEGKLLKQTKKQKQMHVFIRLCCV